jgi:hypothetical protein
MVMPEPNGHAGAVLQAGLLTVIDGCCTHSYVGFIKVRDAGNAQELMVLYFLTRDWSYWCTTTIWLSIVYHLEVAWT